jgi:hypothetical protein
MDENRAKILQGLVCESPNCCETLFDSCDLCKQGLCEACYQGYHLCINDENFGDVNSDGNLVDDSNCFDDDNQSTISGSTRSPTSSEDDNRRRINEKNKNQWSSTWSVGFGRPVIVDQWSAKADQFWSNLVGWSVDFFRTSEMVGRRDFSTRPPALLL